MKDSDEISIPKALYAQEKAQNILGRKKGSLSSFRSGRNGCADHDDTKNSKAISLDALKRSRSFYHEEFARLIQACFQEAKNIPSAVVKVKKAINWKSICRGTMLCLKHLNFAEQSQFACLLTHHEVYFYFPKRNVIWIDLRGIDGNILVRLMNYVEIPIPTSNKQGAFSVTLQGCSSGLPRNPQLFECRIGRIGALTTIPVQMRFEEVEPLICDLVGYSSVAQEIFNLYRGYNFKEVKCVDEEGNNCDMIHCLVPQSFEHVFPCQCIVNKVSFTIDHALPYALPLTVPSRPPLEETRHDHWNKAACYKQSSKKCRRNQMVAKRGCPGSMNRAHCLQEGIIMLEHRKYTHHLNVTVSRCFSLRKRSLVE